MYQIDNQIMLNHNIINSICEYLPNTLIIKFHKTTQFYPNINLWNDRWVDEQKLTKSEFNYLFRNFPAKCLYLNKHSNKFYRKLPSLVKFETYIKISIKNIKRIIKKSNKLKIL
jgi:hypothetical protein